MALYDSGLVVMANALDTAVTHFSLHSSDPGTTGANEVTGGGYARQAGSFSVDADGDLTLAAAESFSGTASSAVTHVGLWTDVSAGTCHGVYALTGDNTFNAAGEYDVTGVTITSTAS